jgi:hypothetical protein
MKKKKRVNVIRYDFEIKLKINFTYPKSHKLTKFKIRLF